MHGVTSMLGKNANPFGLRLHFKDARSRQVFYRERSGTEHGRCVLEARVKVQPDVVEMGRGPEWATAEENAANVHPIDDATCLGLPIQSAEEKKVGEENEVTEEKKVNGEASSSGGPATSFDVVNTVKAASLVGLLGIFLAAVVTKRFPFAEALKNEAVAAEILKFFTASITGLSPAILKALMEELNSRMWQKKVFEVGDEIKVGDLEGKVVFMFLDWTVIERKDKRKRVVGSKFFKEKDIENITQNGGMRMLEGTFSVLSDKGATVDQLMLEIEDSLRKLKPVSLDLTVTPGVRKHYDITYTCLMQKMSHKELRKRRLTMIDQVEELVEKLQLKMLDGAQTKVKVKQTADASP